MFFEFVNCCVSVYFISPYNTSGTLAQLAEQRTLNPEVQGSIPWCPTTQNTYPRQKWRGFFVPSALDQDANLRRNNRFK